MKKKYTTAAELVASVDNLITLPEVYLQVKAVVEDPDSCLSDLVNAISIDPGITARLLRLANSSYFNIRMPVDNIRQAANMLGMKPIHDLVLATTLTKTFARYSQHQTEMQKFWKESVCRAVFASLIAARSGEIEHEALFTGGLLSHIGRQIMYMRIGSEAKDALQISQKTGKALAAVESELIGYNYAEVGGELMRTWKMPDNLCEIVRHHIRPKLSKQFSKHASIVHIAAELTQRHNCQPDAEQRNGLICPTALQWTGLTPAELGSLCADADSLITEAVDLLLTNQAAA